MIECTIKRTCSAAIIITVHSLTTNEARSKTNVLYTIAFDIQHWAANTARRQHCIRQTQTQPTIPIPHKPLANFTQIRSSLVHLIAFFVALCLPKLTHAHPRLHHTPDALHASTTFHDHATSHHSTTLWTFLTFFTRVFFLSLVIPDHCNMLKASALARNVMWKEITIVQY